MGGRRLPEAVHPFGCTASFASDFVRAKDPVACLQATGQGAALQSDFYGLLYFLIIFNPVSNLFFVIFLGHLIDSRRKIYEGFEIFNYGRCELKKGSRL